MASRNFQVRVPAPLETQLVELSEFTGLTYSDILRQTLQYALSHPELLPEILSQHRHMLTMDLRTPQQADNWQQNYEALTSPARVNELLADHYQRMQE